MAKIRSKLHAQIQQLKDDEDERIRRALEEAEARRVREEALKEEKMRKAHEEIAKHREQVVSETINGCWCSLANTCDVSLVCFI